MNAPLERIAHHIRAASADLRLDMARMDMVDVERKVKSAQEDLEAARRAFAVATQMRDAAPIEGKHSAQMEFWRRREFMRAAEFQLDRCRGEAMDAQRAFSEAGGDPYAGIDHEAVRRCDWRAQLGGVIPD